jgi:prepilin-type processing-associated H-X9-DG protein
MNTHTREVVKGRYAVTGCFCLLLLALLVWRLAGDGFNRGWLFGAPDFAKGAPALDSFSEPSVGLAILKQKAAQLLLAYNENRNQVKLPVAEPLPSNPANPQNPLPRISDVLGPYAGKVATTNATPSVFKCPCDEAWFFEAEGSSYQWNEWLNGQRIDLGEASSGGGIAISNGVVLWQINFTLAHANETTPLLVDYDDFHPRPPKSGRNVVYMDGHAATFVPPPLP